jgi:asparagine synthetase B (glutamine-hydrolysing)
VSGILAIAGAGWAQQDIPALLGSINLLGTDTQAQSSRAASGIVAISSVGPRACERRYYQEGDLFACYAGNIIGEMDDIPWIGILEDCRRRTNNTLCKLNGRFAIICFDQGNGGLFSVTDRFAQYPLYWTVAKDCFVVSTSLATFSRLSPTPQINPHWFYEYFTFNFSVSKTTFLDGVSRAADATVLAYDIEYRSIQVCRYAVRFHPPESLLDTGQAVYAALQTFKRRVPNYLNDLRRPAVGLTGGFDSRTILAFALGHRSLISYTYGITGCNDLVAARDLADTLGIPHAEIPFDIAFERQLPHLMYRTVWLSGGLQSVNRSTLLYVYETLSKLGSPPDAVLSGVSGDQVFRGHGNVPSIVSNLMDQVFRTGRTPCNLLATIAAAFHQADPCYKHICDVLAQLQTDQGDLSLPLAHLNYMVYYVPAEYFSGEATIAGQYVDFRSPFCDPEIIDLAFRIPLSTLKLSRFLSNRKNNRQKNFLPARLISSHPRLAALKIHGRPTAAYMGPLAYALSSAHLKLTSSLRRMKKRNVDRKQLPLEDWNRWFGSVMWPSLQELLGKGANIEEFCRRDFIDRSLTERDIFWLNKLVSSEIILRLVRNGWVLSQGGLTKKSV